MGINQDTLALFRWARNSTEAKEAVMEEEFLQKVKATKAVTEIKRNGSLGHLIS